MSQTTALERLHSQQLDRTRLRQPAEVVAWLGAVQAQDYAGAKWSLGLRLPATSEAAVERAIEAKTIVRTWAVRGTLHFVAAADVHWLLALLAPRIIAGCARRYRELELDADTLKRSSRALARAVQGGQQPTRTELLATLRKQGISTRGQRAAYMLQRASLDRLICQGVTRRNNPTYLSLTETAPEGKLMPRDEAAAELARRYFISRGPATLADFVWWSGLGAAEARAGLEAVKTELVEESRDGEAFWLAGGAAAGQARASSRAYLLPGFDEYLLSYRDRSASLAPVDAKRLKPANGMLNPTVVLGGRVIGVWKRTFSKGRVVIAVRSFAPLTAGQTRAVAAAARRFGKFLGMPAVLLEAEIY